jgi:hypothetical protein
MWAGGFAAAARLPSKNRNFIKKILSLSLASHRLAPAEPATRQYFPDFSFAPPFLLPDPFPAKA